MQVVFSYADGPSVVANASSAGPDRLWLAGPGLVDGFHISLGEEDWVAEGGKAVRVEAIVLGGGDRRRSAALPDRRSRHAASNRTSPEGLTYLVRGFLAAYLERKAAGNALSE